MRSFMRGFLYAGRGILVAVREERNLRFHLCTAFYVYVFSTFYSLTRLEYMVLTLAVAAVLGAELVNSAIERTVDKASPERSELARAAKDMAAGAVLLFSIGAAICGLLLFWDTAVFYSIYLWFYHSPFMLFLLVFSLAGSYLFVFRYNRKKVEY